MQKYYGYYKGIIIQRDDSETMGRVKVFVPEVNMSLYKDWNSDKTLDKKFTFLGENLESSLTGDILLRLKRCLPWAVIKHPIFGMSAPVFYDAVQNVSTVSNDADASYQQNVYNKQNINKGEQTVAKDEQQTVNAMNQIATQENISASNQQNNQLLNNKTDNFPDNGQEDNNDNCTVGKLFCADNDNISVPSIPTTTNSSSNNSNNNNSTTSNATNGTSDNIIGIDIYFIPDNNILQNKKNKSFTIEQFTQSQQLGSNIKKTNIGDISVKYSASIKYNLVPSAQITSTIVNDDKRCYYFRQKIVSSITGQTVNATEIPIKFIAQDLSETAQSNSNLIYSDSINTIKFNDTTSTIKGANFAIKTDTIQTIVIHYANPNNVINLESDRLGELVNYLKYYQQEDSSMGQDPIIPPAVILNESYNRGGNGSDLFSVKYSNLLPMQNIVDCQLCGNNPQSLASINQNKQFESYIDPNETVKANLQLKADSKPPIHASTQGNKIKGMISIPAVGAHVSVYFEDGNPQYPIIDGCFYNQEDYAGAYDVAR